MERFVRSLRVLWRSERLLAEQDRLAGSLIEAADREVLEDRRSNLVDSLRAIDGRLLRRVMFTARRLTARGDQLGTICDSMRPPLHPVGSPG